MGYSLKTKQDHARGLAGAVQIGLLTQAETPLGPAVEVNAREYQRQAIFMGLDESGTTVMNTMGVEFPKPEQGFGSVVAYGLFDGNGDLVYQAMFPEPIDFARNLRYSVDPGDIAIMV